MSNPLDEYLNLLSLQLQEMPSEQREAEIEEARQHLAALIQERIDVGDSQDVAFSSAIQQFGSPQENGKGLRETWRRRGRDGRRERFIVVSHRVLGIAMLHSLLAHLLVGIPFYKEYVWDLAPSYYLFPKLFDYWGAEAIPSSVMLILIMLLGLTLWSFLLDKTLRTIFFLVFLLSGTLSAGLHAVGLSDRFLYDTNGHISYFEYFGLTTRTALCLLSMFCFVSELVRSNSLLPAPFLKKQSN